eukprot:2552131-Pleurochrysis_carterae.AAC.2
MNCAFETSRKLPRTTNKPYCATMPHSASARQVLLRDETCFSNSRLSTCHSSLDRLSNLPKCFNPGAILMP